MGAKGNSGLTNAQVQALIDAGYPIAISDVTNLQSNLDAKLESPIAISDVTNLQTNLDAKTLVTLGTDSHVGTGSTRTIINEFFGQKITIGAVDDGYLYRLRKMEVKFSTLSYNLFNIAGILLVDESNLYFSVIAQSGQTYQNATTLTPKFDKSQFFLGGQNIFVGTNKSNVVLSQVCNNAGGTQYSHLAYAYASDYSMNINGVNLSTSTLIPYQVLTYEKWKIGV